MWQMFVYYFLSPCIRSIKLMLLSTQKLYTLKLSGCCTRRITCIACGSHNYIEKYILYWMPCNSHHLFLQYLQEIGWIFLGLSFRLALGTRGKFILTSWTAFTANVTMSVAITADTMCWRFVSCRLRLFGVQYLWRISSYTWHCVWVNVSACVIPTIKVLCDRIWEIAHFAHRESNNNILSFKKVISVYIFKTSKASNSGYESLFVSTLDCAISWTKLTLLYVGCFPRSYHIIINSK